ncbi:FAD-dependent oxidoreductase [Rothia sp. AR01]|uniref:FAD-dependent oxidoreductase n=1 Tax=Rothia santali TaxID=2949643 RepID=A0A9X2KKM7_9MICC|nr:FAD-dependent oxidoreductase [Rothia santali]MCP3425216.1 FAD-dependent oxidoreductase [Rothia santali]
MHEVLDVAVIGAGPAGLSAAVHAGEQGLRVALIDAGIQPGGQYWRHPDENHPVDDEAHGHHHWKTFTDLRARLKKLRLSGSIAYSSHSQVWFIERPAADQQPWTLRINAVTDGRDNTDSSRVVRAQRVILCPGGYDRQLPIPGWDLPGTMAAGGVQALLKGHRSLAGRKALVAGTGPFLLPVAVGLADAGAEVISICEAGDLSGWLKNTTRAAQMPSKAIEGAQYAAALLKHHIAYKPKTVVSRINGDTEVSSATVSKVDAQGRLIVGSERTVEVDLVALGWGFTPSMELVIAVGAQTRQDVDESLVAVVDELQHSSVENIYIAGEATGVGGAAMAIAEGELAAYSVLIDMNRRPAHSRIRSLQGIVRRSRAFAQAMHQAHPVPKHWTEWLTDDAIICRCEEVTYGKVCQSRDDLGAQDARSVKLLARPGMGWCQGRVCGFATAKIAAEIEGRKMRPEDLVSTHKRSLTSPVTLEDLGTPDN